MREATTTITAACDLTMSPLVVQHYQAFDEAFGVGPCGAYAAVLRERGYGDIAACEFRPQGDSWSFPHYVVIRPDGRILDATNPFAAGDYLDLHILPPGELPDQVGDAELAFWRRLL